jgi:hypothetical protein
MNKVMQSTVCGHDALCENVDRSLQPLRRYLLTLNGCVRKPVVTLSHKTLVSREVKKLSCVGSFGGERDVDRTLTKHEREVVIVVEQTLNRRS